MKTVEVEPFESRSAWQLFFIGDPDKPYDSDFFQSITELEAIDKKYVNSGLELFLKHAANGKELNCVYDKKDCHDAFTFSHKENKHTVWRIRKGNARIYFYYAENKIILLCNTLSKHADKLTKAEQNNIAEQVKRYLNANGDVEYKECEYE